MATKPTSPSAPSAPVVTHAGVTEAVTLGPRRYVLAAPVFSAVGDFLDAQARSTAPTPAEQMEAVRAALEEGGHETSALDACDEAEDAWVSFVNVHQVTGPDATENIQAQAVELNRAMLTARRARDRAVARVQRHPAVLAMQAQRQQAQWREHCGLVALLLRSWEGEGLPAFPDALDGDAVGRALPMGDVAALAQRAFALMQPTAAAGNG